MKKRILSGLLLTATVAAGFSTFTSCKDTDEDLRTEFTSQQMSLEAALAKLKATVDDIKSCECKPLTSEDIEKLLKQDPSKSTIESWIKSQIDALNLFGEDGKSGVIGGINNDINNLESIIAAAGLDNLTPEQAAAFKALVPKANELLNLLENYQPSTPSTPYDDAWIRTKFTELSNELGDIKDLINGNEEKGIVGLEQRISDNENNISGLQAWFAEWDMTPEKFQEYVEQGEWVKDNKTSMETLFDYIYGNAEKGIEGKKDLIDSLNKDALDALNTYYTQFGDLKKMYDTLFPNGVTEGEDWWSYKETLDAIKNNQEDIKTLQDDVEKLFDLVNNMVTSLVLQTTVNPLFGSINTPFGINSMVLMSYYGVNTTGFDTFPAHVNDGTEYCGIDADPSIISIDWAAMMRDANTTAYSPVSDNLIATNKDGLATLGTLWFTVNPSTVSKLNGTFSLVNSIDKEVPVKFEAVKDNETVFKFGFGSRSAEDNGLYRAEAMIAPEDLDNIKINIEPNLKDALVNAVKNHTVTDMAQMLKTVYNQLQNICDANALRYTWDSYESKNNDGTWNTKENKVYTNYGLAATSFKPLSFHTLYGTSISHKLPTYGSIQINKDDFQFDFGTIDLGDLKIELDMKFESVTINDVAETLVNVKIPARYELVDGAAVLPDNWDKGPEWSESNPNGTWKYVQVDIASDLNEVISQIRDSIDEWVYGSDDKKGFNQQIEEAVNKAVDSAFNGPDGFKTKIEEQIKSIEGNIQGKVDDLVDMINKDYLGKVNNLISKYNKVADKINNMLSDPNHYLQSMMMYKDANGNLHMLSTDPNCPSQFKGNGEAIELIATTYNFETICPVFKKFVGVNKVTTANGTANTAALKKAANNANNFMASAIDGDRQRVVLDVKGATKGVYTYEIAYQALDFHGYTSTVKCYIQVIR